MECQIFWADTRRGLAAGNIQRRAAELPPFDTSSMHQPKFQEKPALNRGFEQFQERWKETWQRLPVPQAGLVRWSRQELCGEFLPACPPEESACNLIEQCRCAYAAVWTIGPALEAAAFEEVRGSALQAMFLDVAGSLIMGTIRQALHQLASQEEDAAGQHVVLGEYAPEIRERDRRLSLIVDPWRNAPPDLRPNFNVKDNGVLQPLKSQCAMLFLGVPQAGQTIRLDEIPCSHCKGSKCLYRQFGGCHLPIEKQPVKKRREPGER